MTLLDTKYTFYAMTTFLDSYYFMTETDDSLGSLLGSMIMWRNDNDELFDQAIWEDWITFFNAVTVSDHTPLEGFQAVKQFVNEYLPDTIDTTELARRVTYNIDLICDMRDDERGKASVWINWTAAISWLSSPDTFLVKESPFKDSERSESKKSNSRKKGFPIAKELSGKCAINFECVGDQREISEKQIRLIMLEFVHYYYEISGGDRDLENILRLLNPENDGIDIKTINWYFSEVAVHATTVNLFQALYVVNMYMLIQIPDNALHTSFSRQLTRNIWHTVYMPDEAGKQTEIWKNWTLAIEKIAIG